MDITKSGRTLWLTSCLLASFIYSAVFVTETFPKPAFNSSFSDYIIIAIIFSLISIILSIPIIYLINGILKSQLKNKQKYIWNNIIWGVVVLITFSISSNLMKSLIESLKLTFSYGTIGVFSTNVYQYYKLIGTKAL